MDQIIDELIFFCKIVKSIVEKIDNEIIGKTKVITFNDILYYCLYMNGNSCSYSMANIHMFLKGIFDITDSSLIQKRDSISFTYFRKISDELVSFIYKDIDIPRIIGVDGTYIPLSIELKNYGFSVSRKNTYCIGLISSLFDVENKILINYKLRKSFSERDGLMSQIKYLRCGDILIMDRGYYSKKLLFFLHEHKIKVIFRMKISSLMVKNIIEKKQESMNTTIIHNNKTIRFRIVAYKINNNDYFLGTTIMNHKVSYFKNLYWKRWTLETNFRESKYLLSLDNILSRNENKVRQDIYAHNILFLISSFFRNKIQTLLPVNNFINTTNLLNLIVNEIMYLILYKKITKSIKEEIKRIVISLLKSPVIKNPNRHYERIRIKPIGKWYFCVKHKKRLDQINNMNELL